MTFSMPTSVWRQASWSLPLLALAACAGWWAMDLSAPRTLAASTPPLSDDTDGDGLVDDQEGVLGTNHLRVDTDEDGFSDLEELARGTSPLFPQSKPELDRLHVGLTCRGDGTNIHAVLAVYLPDGKLRNKGVDGGVLINGNRYLSLSQVVVMANARLRMNDAAAPEAKIAVFDLPFSPRYVRALGELSLFGVVRHRPGGLIASADAKRLVSIGSVIALQMQNPLIFSMGGLQGSPTQTGSSTGVNLGSIYVPLPVSGGNGGESYWTPGQVCVQQTQVVGVSGNMTIQEVVSAECQVGWDGYCPPNCQSTVGDTFTTVDPLVLIGG